MQGIRLSEYKILIESLSQLRKMDSINLPEEHSRTIMEKEEKLKEVYKDYLRSLQQVSESIQQFEHQKHSIRRLIKKSRHYLKDATKMIKTAMLLIFSFICL
jgi:hypothetical protein